MTPFDFMKLAAPIAKLYLGLETDLMHNIASYVGSQALMSSTAQWKIKKLANLGALNKQNIKTIAKYSKVLPDMVEIALTSAALAASGEIGGGFGAMVTDGILKGSSTNIGDGMAKTIRTYVKQAQKTYNLVNTVMQYKAKNAANKLINDTAELSNKQDFLNMLNKATGKAVTGIESRQAALRQCIGEMTDKGIPAFTDKLGRQWSPEAYINMDIRTTCANVAHQTQFDYMDSYKVDLIEVSSHMGARPKCADVQGRIFDRANKSKKYPHWSSTSYGQPDGILGINCRHQIYPFIDGVNVQTYFPQDEEENAKAYKLSQQQRQLERDVRSSKRKCMALDTIGDKDGFSKASVKLKAKEAKLKNFCKANDLPCRSDRTAVVGYNRSVSAKAVSANKKALQNKVDKLSERGIIKEEGESFSDRIRMGEYPVEIVEKYNSIIKNEPQISKDLKNISRKNDFKLSGYDERLKTKKSTFEKLIRQNDISLETAVNRIDKMYDIIRYTYECEKQNMVNDYFYVRGELENRGYIIKEVKNQWMNDKIPYNGVNLKVLNPDRIKFELQFHTTDSLNLKNGKLHELYEKQRVIKDIQSKEWIDLNNEMFELSNKLDKPTGIERIK